MGIDYYSLLAINANAKLDEINQAYRRAVLRLHPLRNEDKKVKMDTFEEFKLVSEAYDVLTNPRFKACYDHFGEEGLKNGAPQNGSWSEKYLYHGDPYKTFKNFFGGENPFYEIESQIKQEEMENFGSSCGHGQAKLSVPIELDLPLTLEEIYNGCTKRVSVTRNIFVKDCHTTVRREKVFSILIRPGLKEGSRITFSNEGNQGPNALPGDVVFILKTMHHQIFRRDGIDLYQTIEVPLSQALLGCIIDVKTLDDRILHIPITEIIHPQYIKTVDDEGMPDPCSQGNKGKLFIDFDIKFPRRLLEAQKLAIEAALFPGHRIPVSLSRY